MYKILVAILLLVSANSLLSYNSSITLPSRMTMALSAGQAHLTMIAPTTGYSDYKVLLYNLSTSSFVTLGTPIDNGAW